MSYSLRIDTGRIKAKIVTPDAKIYANTRMYVRNDKYVPFRSGRLSKDVRVTEDYIHYLAPYAARCYYGNFNFRKDYHPNATNRWAEFMYANEKEEYLRELQRYIEVRL